MTCVMNSRTCCQVWPLERYLFFITQAFLLMCKKEVLSLPAGDTHAIITKYAVYASPLNTQPLNRRGEAETAYYAFRQGSKQGQSGQINEVYTLVYAVLLNPILALGPQLKTAGIKLTRTEVEALSNSMQAASRIETRYKAVQWFHVLKKHCDLLHKPRPAVPNTEHAMYFPLELLLRHRRPMPC